ncbi:MAG: M56 family metallopeptidase, partial [Saprospiraceae bacterium]
KTTDRYYIALSSLLVACITSLGTFLYYFSGFEQVADQGVLAVQHTPIILDISNDVSFFVILSQWIEAWSVPLYLAWMVGVVFCSIKFLFSLGYTEYLSRATMPVFRQDTYRIFAKVKQHFAISSSISIGESKYIKSPALLGILKPIVLFPVGVINQLDPKETEAIIAHELAHFVRKDIYVNILQTIVEVMFYYHPAMWWISANIRLERETCCDDLAIGYMGDHLHYAKTLVKMQEMYHQSYGTSLALNFSKKESYFSNRIKRILNMTQSKNYLKEKIITSLIIIAAVMFLSKNLVGNHSIMSESKDDQINTTIIIDKPSAHDTIPVSKESVRIQKKTDDKDVKMSMENGQVTELEVDGNKIAPKDYHQYEGLIQEMKPKGKMGGNTFLFRSEDGKPLNFQFGGGDLDSIFNGLSMKGFGKMGDIIQWRDLDGMEGFKNFEGFQMNHEDLRKNMEKLQENMAKMKFDFEGFDSIGHNFKFDFPIDMDMDVEGMYDGNIFEFKDLDRSKGRGWNGNQSEEDYGPNNFTEALGSSLNRDGFLIPGKENKVELTGKYLKINGEKQPENIYQKYKRIFEEQSGAVLK